jgi:hypothetical protein
LLAPALSLLCAFAIAPAPAQQTPDVPYVVTPMNVVDAMLEIANVGAEDFVIDLGSGDGRIVIAAAKKRGARGLGVELDGSLVNDARREAQRQGVANKVEFLMENLFVTDIGRASVLMTYLFPRVNMQLRPVIFAQLKPGSRVVSHEFDFGNWKPDAHVTVKVPDKPYGPPRSEVFLWVVPANAAGRWQWRTQLEGAEIECEMTLEQTFQELRGSALAGGKPARLENPRLRGEEIRFTLLADVSGRQVRQEVAARVSGDSMAGKARAPHAESGFRFEAKRVLRGKINIDAAAGFPAVAATLGRLDPSPPTSLPGGAGRLEVQMH